MKTKLISLFVLVVMLFVVASPAMAFYNHQSNTPPVLGGGPKPKVMWVERVTTGPSLSRGQIKALVYSPCTITTRCLGAQLMGPGIPPGDVFPAGIGETIRALKLILNGDPSTFLMQSPTGNWLLAWYSKGNTWSFLGVTADGQVFQSIQKFLGGNKVNTMSMSEFIKALEKSGWQYKTVADLPPRLFALMQGASTWLSAFSSASGFMPSLPIVFIVPLQTLEVFKYLYPVTINN